MNGRPNAATDTSATEPTTEPAESTEDSSTSSSTSAKKKYPKYLTAKEKEYVEEREKLDPKLSKIRETQHEHFSVLKEKLENDPNPIALDASVSELLQNGNLMELVHMCNLQNTNEGKQPKPENSIKEDDLTPNFLNVVDKLHRISTNRFEDMLSRLSEQQRNSWIVKFIRGLLKSMTLHMISNGYVKWEIVYVISELDVHTNILDTSNMPKLLDTMFRFLRGLYAHVDKRKKKKRRKSTKRMMRKIKDFQKPPGLSIYDIVDITRRIGMVSSIRPGYGGVLGRQDDHYKKFFDVYRLNVEDATDGSYSPLPRSYPDKSVMCHVPEEAQEDILGNYFDDLEVLMAFAIDTDFTILVHVTKLFLKLLPKKDYDDIMNGFENSKLSDDWTLSLVLQQYNFLNFS